MDWFRIDLTDSKFYSQNMEALQTRYPQKAAWLSTWESAVDELEVARHEGSFACRHADHGFLFYAPERFIKQQQTIVDRVTTLFQRGAQMWLVCGTGLGYVSSHLEKQYHGNLTKGFVLLENRPALILAQFALFDCKNFISSTQTYWGIGEDIFAELQAIIEEERLYGLPETSVFFYPERELDETERALYQKAGRWFLNYKRSKQEQVDSARKHFAERMSQPANLKSGTIWAVATPQAYAHTPLMHSLMSGFASLGWNKKVLELKEGFSTRLRVSADLVETAPDAVLCCNSASGTYVSPQVRRPRISWILDHPRYFGSDSLVNDLTELDHIVYCDRSYAPYFTHLPVASHQFVPVTPMVTRKGIQKEEYKAPIVFVGSYSNLDAYLYKLRKNEKEEVHSILPYLAKNPTQNSYDALHRLKVSNQTMEALRNRAQAYIGTLHREFPDERIEMEYFLYSLTNSYKREQLIRELLEYGLVIYGPNSWFPFLGETYANRLKGWVPLEELPDVYASADVVLNMHSLQCPTCLNCRDFDVLAAGGCLLTDWVEDVEQGYITPGSDCVVFHHVNQMKDAVERLLSNPEERAAIRETGRQTYLQSHTPRHRAETILETMKASMINGDNI